MTKTVVPSSYASPVRRVREGDLEKVAALERAVFPKGIAESPKTIRDRFKVFREGFLVCEDGGKLLGYVTSELWPEMARFENDRLASEVHQAGGKIMHVSSLAVHPLHQSKGIGTVLMHALLDVARQRKCAKMVLISRRTLAPAHAFYKKFRFKHKETISGFFKPAGGAPVDGFVFELDLRPGSKIKDKIPKKLDANQLLQRLSAFMRALKPEDKIALVHHLDADGLTSACVLNRAIEKLRGKPADLEIPSGYSDKQAREEVIPLLAKHGITKAFVSDIGIDANPIIISEGPKHIQFVVLDHHKIYRDLTSDRVLFIKSQYLSSLDGSKYPASKLCYDCMNSVVDVSELDWVAAVGVLADMGLETWNKFIQDTCLKNKVSLENLLELKELISAAESLAPKRFPELFREFYAAKSWRALMKSPFMKYKKTLHREVSRFCDQVYKKAEFVSELDLIFYEIKSKYEIKSALVNKLSVEMFPKQTFILVQDKGDDMLRFSGRRQDFKVKMNDLLEEAVQGLELGSAGGHIPAAAGRIAKSEFQHFKSNVIRILVRQYFKSFKIRHASAKDVEDILKIERRSLKNKGLFGFKPVYEARIRVHPKGVFVAEINDRAVGFCCTERWSADHPYQTNRDPSCVHDPKGKTLFISSLGVLPEFHGKGIGSALVSQALEFAKEAGCVKVATCVDTFQAEAQGLFKRFGFRLAKRVRDAFCVVEKKRCRHADGLYFELKLKK